MDEKHFWNCITLGVIALLLSVTSCSIVETLYSKPKSPEQLCAAERHTNLYCMKMLEKP